MIHTKSLRLETNTWFASTITFLQVLNTIEILKWWKSYKANLQVLNTIEILKWWKSYKAKWMLSASGVPRNSCSCCNSHCIAPIVIAQLIFVPNEVVYMIIWEMFHGGIYLKLLFLLLLVNCLSGFSLELMHNLSL